MLRGSKIGRSLLGKSIQLQFTPTPKSPQAAGAKRRSCRHGPAVPKGGRRKAPRPPPGPGPATATCPHVSPAAPTNNGPIAGRSQPSHRRWGRAQLSEHSADQCGALSAAPKEQDKAPHMIEDVLKAEPGPPPDSSTATRRAAWRSGRRWLPRPYGFGRHSTRR